MAPNITGNIGMDGESLRRAVAADPNLFAKLQNIVASLTSGGGDPAQATKITGNVGLEPAVSGSVRVAGGAGSPGVTMSGGGGGGGTRPPVTGSGADAPLPSGRGGGTSSIPNPRTGVPAPNQVTGAGFEGLLNQLRTGVGANRGLLGKAARYGPGAGRTLEEFGKGNYLEALGSAGGMVAAGAGVKALAAGIPAVGLPGMLAKGGLYAAGSLLGSDIGANLAGGVGKLFGIGGQAAQDAAGAADRRTMAEGKSPTGLPGTGGKGLESLTFEQLQELIRMQGSGLLESASPIINRNRNAEMSRTLQLNQQVGQLTGALNQQKYMADLALGAQSEAGATTRTMLTAPNPYASSAFQYRG
jgi:hypothetical protein